MIIIIKDYGKMEKLYECLKKKKINNSRAREVIYDVLCDAKGCMSVSSISNESNARYPKKISLNTIYRHLGLFVECKLAVMVQDDYKRAFYCIADKDTMLFSICPQCNILKKETVNEHQREYIGQLITGKRACQFITLHEYCQRCEK